MQVCVASHHSAAIYRLLLLPLYNLQGLQSRSSTRSAFQTQRQLSV